MEAVSGESFLELVDGRVVLRDPRQGDACSSFGRLGDLMTAFQALGAPLFTLRTVETTASEPRAADPFAGTGIIVVGAGVPKEPGKPGSNLLKRSAYSQFGPGLAILAPSDGPAYDDVPPPVGTCAGPAPDLSARSDIPIATSDLYGHAGFAEKPDAWASSARQRQGFGGTSAAAAIVTGLIARLAERNEADAHSWGIEARKMLTDASKKTAIAFVAPDQSEGWINFLNVP